MPSSVTSTLAKAASAHASPTAPVRAFLRFVEGDENLDFETPITQPPSSVSADFNAWMQTAEHTGPGPEGDDDNQELHEGYSVSTRRVHSLSDQVPPDVGDRMLEAVDSPPLPNEAEIPNPRSRCKARLETLRARALIHTLRATALRAGNLHHLTRTDV